MQSSNSIHPACSLQHTTLKYVPGYACFYLCMTVELFSWCSFYIFAIKSLFMLLTNLLDVQTDNFGISLRLQLFCFADKWIKYCRQRHQRTLVSSYSQVLLSFRKRLDWHKWISLYFITVSYCMMHNKQQLFFNNVVIMLHVSVSSRCWTKSQRRSRSKLCTIIQYTVWKWGYNCDILKMFFSCIYYRYADHLQGCRRFLPSARPSRVAPFVRKGRSLNFKFGENIPIALTYIADSTIFWQKRQREGRKNFKFDVNIRFASVIIKIDNLIPPTTHCLKW